MTYQELKDELDNLFSWVEDMNANVALEDFETIESFKNRIKQ